MTLGEWLTLAGIVLSPIVAVIISLWIEGRRRKRDGQMAVVRMLIATSHLPADPSWSTAINLLRVEFASSAPVMQAFKNYQQVIRRERPATDQGIALLQEDVKAVQIKLLSAVLADVGMKVSEADLAIEGYASEGFIVRDNLYLDSLRAQMRIADALERTAEGA
jgi:hypothetical protein